MIRENTDDNNFFFGSLLMLINCYLLNASMHHLPGDHQQGPLRWIAEDAVSDAAYELGCR